MKVNMPHRYLRRSRVKRLMEAGWYEYFSGKPNSWTHQQHTGPMVSMSRALELQAGWDGERKAKST